MTDDNAYKNAITYKEGGALISSNATALKLLMENISGHQHFLEIKLY